MMTQLSVMKYCYREKWSYKYPHKPVSECVNGRLSLEYNDSVSHVCSHDKVVLHNECCLLRMKDKPKIFFKKLCSMDYVHVTQNTLALVYEISTVV